MRFYRIRQGFLLLLLGLFTARLCWCDSLAGPYRIIPGHFEKCPPEMRPKKLTYIFKYSRMRNRKDTNNWLYSWNGTTFFSTDDFLRMDVNIASWSSRGGWKDNAFVFKLPRCCYVFKTCAPDLWRKVMIAIFNDPTRDCPIGPGDYSFTNLSTDFNMKNPPSFFYGKWRATAALVKAATGEVMVCIRAYGSTAPKGRLLKEDELAHMEGST